ncbi:MAG: PspC domain-containing protein [Bacteroidota bacterium]|nr:PspC domain-containing protein [Bacteroidota bacterium]
MNKVLNINVGGIPFSIDDTAFERLDKYLLSLENHFSKSEGCFEIMQDIEARISEIFREKLGNRTIVSLDTVNQTIEVMGTPEVFGADWNETENPHQQKNTHDWGISVGKKLYRDMSDAKVSGVCSGLAHYFGVQDTVWIRLIFVLGVFVGGFSVIAYIVLWALVPKAKTSADFLAMKGEPINIQNIARKVEEEIDTITDKFEDWRDKRKHRKKKWHSRF